VLGNLSLILDDATVPPEVRARAEEIQLASERAANLTRQLLAFGRRQMLARASKYLSVIVVEMLKTVCACRGRADRTRDRAERRSCPVLVDRVQIEQVILNMVLNARDAMPEGRRIVIGSRPLEPKDAWADDTPLPRPGRYVLLSVSDTGAGMDARLRPASSSILHHQGTVAVGRPGAGDRLRIVQQSGGCDPRAQRAGPGFTFDARAAVERDAAAPGRIGCRASRRDGGRDRAGRGDEAQVRGLMRDALARAGFRVFEAPNGREALEIAAAVPGPVTCWSPTSDAGMDGSELADRLFTVRPSLRVLYVNGYAIRTRCVERVRSPVRPAAQAVRDGRAGASGT